MCGADVKIPVIVGATASGKTALSVNLARLIDGEIISADSRQIYKYMDIGTDKPGHEIRQAIPHHFIDCKLPDEYYTAGQYGIDANLRIEEICGRGRWPLVVGGSGLYIRALTDGLFTPRVSDIQVKEALRKRMAELGLDALYSYLREVDPDTAERLHANDAQRIIRALEVYEISGIPISRHQSQQVLRRRRSWVFVGLRWQRQKLYARIEERIDAMITRGLVDEVRRLKAMGYTEKLNSMQSVGYKEICAVIDNRCDLQTAIIAIKKNSRNYAKRQLTWFRGDQRIQWYDVDEGINFASFAGEIKRACV